MAVRVIVADDQNISRGFFEMYVRAAVGYELAGGFRAAKEAVAVNARAVGLVISDTDRTGT